MLNAVKDFLQTTNVLDVGRSVALTDNDIGISAVAVKDMSNDSMSWLAPVEMWTKSRLGYQQLSFIPCYVSGVATLAGVENKERRYHTRCNVANRTSRLVATLYITLDDKQSF